MISLDSLRPMTQIFFFLFLFEALLYYYSFSSRDGGFSVFFIRLYRCWYIDSESSILPGILLVKPGDRRRLSRRHLSWGFQVFITQCLDISVCIL